MSVMVKSCLTLVCIICCGQYNDDLFLAGSRDQEISTLEPSSGSGQCCNQRVEHLTPSDMISKFDGPKLEQLVKARNMGVLEMSPEDEVEGEIIFHQHKLLCNVITKKCISGMCFVPFCNNLSSLLPSFYEGQLIMLNHTDI